jgi:IPT/TIG domain
MRISARMALAVVALLIAPGCNDNRVTQSTEPSPMVPVINPMVPVINSVTPDSAVTGSSDLTVTVKGANFVKGSSVVKCVESGRATVLTTTFVSETELTAVIPANLLQDAVTLGLSVQNVGIFDRSNGSPQSNEISFSVRNLGITSISPATAIAGSPDLTVVITGTGFVKSLGAITSVAKWTARNIVAPPGHSPEIVLTTRFLSDTELSAVIPATLLKDPIDAQLLVQNADIMGLSDGYEGYPKSNPISFSVLGSAIRFNRE